MESKLEIILIGSVDRLLELYGAINAYNCLNVYYKDEELIIIAHRYNELIDYMRTSGAFTDREYVLKELSEEEENKYLALFNMTDENTVSNIIYEEYKSLPKIKYPSEEWLYTYINMGSEYV